MRKILVIEDMDMHIENLIPHLYMVLTNQKTNEKDVFEKAIITPVKNLIDEYLFEDEAIRITTVRNATEAIALLEKDEYDFITLDGELVGSSGQEVIDAMTPEQIQKTIAIANDSHFNRYAKAKGVTMFIDKIDLVAYSEPTSEMEEFFRKRPQ